MAWLMGLEIAATCVVPYGNEMVRVGSCCPDEGGRFVFCMVTLAELGPMETAGGPDGTVMSFPGIEVILPEMFPGAGLLPVSTFGANGPVMWEVGARLTVWSCWLAGMTVILEEDIGPILTG